jgi:hypothetical protein
MFNAELKQTDIYSLSMVMYEILTGYMSWISVPKTKIVDLVKNGQRPELPPDFKKHLEESKSNNESTQIKAFIDLMKKCWDQVPRNRPSSDEVLNEIKRILSI